MKSENVRNAAETQALWVTGSADHSSLLRDLEAAGITVVAVKGCNQARRMLQEQPRWKAVVTDVTLADGNWSTVLKEVLRRGLPATVLVCASDHDSRLLSEVVQRGCHYVLEDGGAAERILRLAASAPARRGTHSEYSDIASRAANA